MAEYIVNPVQVRTQESEKGKIYESIVALGMRSRQINDDIKNEIYFRLEDVVDTSETREGSNFDQLAISKEFDKVPKPTFLAMKEIFEGKLKFEYPEESDEEEQV